MLHHENTLGATNSAHGSSGHSIVGYNAVITRQRKNQLNEMEKLLYFFIARISYAKY